MEGITKYLRYKYAPYLHVGAASLLIQLSLAFESNSALWSPSWGTYFIPTALVLGLIGLACAVFQQELVPLVTFAFVAGWNAYALANLHSWNDLQVAAVWLLLAVVAFVYWFGTLGYLESGRYVMTPARQAKRLAVLTIALGFVAIISYGASWPKVVVAAVVILFVRIWALEVPKQPYERPDGRRDYNVGRNAA